MVDDTTDYNMVLSCVDQVQGEGSVVSIINKKKNVKKQISDLEQLGYSKFIFNRDLETI